MAYLDAAQDRLTDHGRDRFATDVESVRAGTIFAHDDKQYGRWTSQVARQSGRAREDAITIEQLARDFPDHVGLPN